MKCVARALALALCAFAAQAQTLPQRDPTQPPASVVDEVAGSLLANGQSANVVVRDGKPFLVVGSRLVAPGQVVENYRLERITETEIWLRDASGLTKVARFAGVQRQPSAAQCTAVPGKNSSPAKTVSPKKPAKRPTPARRTDAHPPSPKNNAHDC